MISGSQRCGESLSKQLNTITLQSPDKIPVLDHEPHVTIRDITLIFLPVERMQEFHTDDVYFPDQDRVLDQSCRKGNFFNQSEALHAQICVVTHISMQFLRSFLRRHFEGKILVTSSEMSAVFSGQNKNLNLPQPRLILYYFLEDDFP